MYFCLVVVGGSWLLFVKCPCGPLPKINKTRVVLFVKKSPNNYEQRLQNIPEIHENAPKLVP